MERHPLAPGVRYLALFHMLLESSQHSMPSRDAMAAERRQMAHAAARQTLTFVHLALAQYPLTMLSDETDNPCQENSGPCGVNP